MLSREVPDEASQELTEMLNDALQLPQLLTTPLTARPGWEVECGYIFGWFRHLEYTFEATQALLANDYGHALAPLVRVMLEDAVSAQLVAQDPQSWQAVLVAARQSEARLRSAMDAAGVDVPSEFEAFFNSLPSDEGDGYRQLRQMTGRFYALGVDGGRLLVSWGRLTQESHGNVHTSNMFLDFTSSPDGLPVVRRNPQRPLDIFHIYFICLDSMLLCIEALGSVLIDDPMKEPSLAIHARKKALEDRLLAAQESSATHEETA